ncbi:hypothetical protein DFH07DRAFT_190264 [Mycena maculata]|uniref:Uncharacterized protein n=1 Tax=Mycena maculata TaxID=230809 RepID=A0AAD7KDT6_9AGAR|nr:hypothetical protein DFH07DRAFT_190264 [Mycena maculata]
MLKRLRPASPPPSTPSIPLVSDPSDSCRHQPKRRRILPPSLDGQSRHLVFRTSEDDGEEDDDDEDDMSLAYDRNPSGAGPSGSTVHNTEYQSANTFLHELHALHKHRLIFSPSWQPSSPPRPSPASRYQDKSYLPQIPDYHRPPNKDSSGMQSFQSELPYEEVQSVKERYGDTNKFRPCLFLLRLPISYLADCWAPGFSLGENNLINHHSTRSLHCKDSSFLFTSLDNFFQLMTLFRSRSSQRSSRIFSAWLSTLVTLIRRVALNSMGSLAISL